MLGTIEESEDEETGLRLARYRGCNDGALVMHVEHISTREGEWTSESLTWTVLVFPC